MELIEKRNLENNIKATKEDVIDNIIKNYGNKILKLCYVQLGNIEDAEDVTQEVLIKIMKNLDKYEERAQIYTWIYRITINSCYDFLKKRKKVIIEDLNMYKNLKSENDEIEETILKNISSQNIRKALMEINEKYRIVLYMFYFEEFKIKEIANILESNENTIKTIIRRGKLALKKIIESEER